MTNNETISNNTLDIVSVRHKRFEDFSMVPTKPYELLVTEDVIYRRRRRVLIYCRHNTL